VVGDSGQLFGRRTGDPNVQLGIELARVAGHNLSIQLLGEPYGVCSLAGCRGAEYEDESADGGT